MKKLMIAMVLALGMSCYGSSTYIFGFEDTPGTATIENNGDFNDAMFSITGNLTLEQSGGIWSDFNSSVVDESGTVYWDNPSLDGPDMNIGYQLLDNSAFSSFQDIQYLAQPNGSAVSNVEFTIDGSITFDDLGGIASDTDTIGLYNVSSPNTLIPVLTNRNTVGTTETFDLDGTYVLYGFNGTDLFSSRSGEDINNDDVGQQHFAIFSASEAPEPASFMLVGTVLIGLGLIKRKKI